MRSKVLLVYGLIWPEVGVVLMLANLCAETASIVTIAADEVLEERLCLQVE